MNRRGFLKSILACGVAPAAIGSGILMPVRRIWTTPPIEVIPFFGGPSELSEIVQMAQREIEHITGITNFGEPSALARKLWAQALFRTAGCEGFMK